MPLVANLAGEGDRLRPEQPRFDDGIEMFEIAAPHDCRQRHVAGVKRPHHRAFCVDRQNRRRKPRLKWPWRLRIDPDNPRAIGCKRRGRAFELTSGCNNNTVVGVGRDRARKRQFALVVAQCETAVLDHEMSDSERGAPVGIALFCPRPIVRAVSTPVQGCSQSRNPDILKLQRLTGQQVEDGQPDAGGINAQKVTLSRPCGLGDAQMAD